MMQMNMHTFYAKILPVMTCKLVLDPYAVIQLQASMMHSDQFSSDNLHEFGVRGMAMCWGALHLAQHPA